MTLVRRPMSVLIAAPLAVAGSLLAHHAGHHIAVPHAASREAALVQSGHSYLEHIGFFIGGLVAVACLLALIEAFRGRGVRGSAARAAWFLPLGFLAQETIERLATGTLEAGTFADPALLIGLLLQIPLALVAFALASFLERAARFVVEAVLRPLEAQAHQVCGASFVSTVAVLRSRLVGTLAGRAPPALLPS